MQVPVLKVAFQAGIIPLSHIAQKYCYHTYGNYYIHGKNLQYFFVQVQFLCEQVESLVYSSSGACLLAWCLEHPVSSSPAPPALPALLAALRLPPLQETVLCLGLAAAASKPEIREDGEKKVLSNIVLY